MFQVPQESDVGSRAPDAQVRPMHVPGIVWYLGAALGNSPLAPDVHDISFLFSLLQDPQGCFSSAVLCVPCPYCPIPVFRAHAWPCTGVAFNA